MTGRDVIKLLEAHGWTLDRITGSHHVFKKTGERVAIVVPVHGSKDLKRGTLNAILRQAGVKR